MNLALLHPRDQITMIMARIYKGGMTTTSGGNVSIRDENGDIWITPATIDKGTLTEKDIVCVHPDGKVSGPHRPSSELPFHRAIYQRRPDIKALVHAHPPALVTFSIVRQIPNTRVIPQAKHVCGEVGYARYELPGSEALGESIAGAFETGSMAIIMENHGTVVGGSDVFDAFQRFETLEFCARTIIKAHEIGKPGLLTDEQINQFEHRDYLLPEFDATSYPADERALRGQICRLVQRACDQHLMISTYGTVSARWRGDDFLITPTGKDRRYISPEDVVQIRDGHRERGKTPSRSVRLHQAIYRRHPHINSIISTQSPNTTAFCISGKPINTRTIPESYLMLKDLPLVPYGSQYSNVTTIPDTLGNGISTILIQNDAILVTGSSLLETFDRLEVAEFSARSLINAVPLGELVPMDDQAIQRLVKAFEG